jgi:hypothetical protein
MHQLLFKNRFNALVFVAIILFSVRILVGTPDESGALEQATAKFDDKHEQIPEPASRMVHAAPEPVATEFTPDEELIDDTSGDDPVDWSAESNIDNGSGPETATSVEFLDTGDEFEG